MPLADSHRQKLASPAASCLQGLLNLLESMLALCTRFSSADRKPASTMVSGVPSWIAECEPHKRAPALATSLLHGDR